MAGAYLLPDRPCRELDAYRRHGGGTGLDEARAHDPARVRELVTASGLRGRDAAAVAVGPRWAQVAAADPSAGPRYVVAIGTDSEPGSFVDRALVRRNPFGIVEGLVIAARAVGAGDAYLLIRRSFEREYEILADMLAEAEVAGWFEDVAVKVVRGPDEYLVGEDRAALEVIEGRAPVPLRGAPSVDGLFSRDDRDLRSVDTAVGVPCHPTVVETFETLVNVAGVLANGPSWYRSMGTSISPGHLLVTVTGDVRRHRVAEVDLGKRTVDVLEEVGDGFVDGRPPKAVLSGVTAPVLTRSRLSAPLCWEGLAAVGSALGRAAFTVHGEGTDMVAVAHGISTFLYVESCGLCPPCKFGGGEVAAHLARLVAGSGSLSDVEAIGARLATVADGRRCELPTRHREAVASILRAFPGDVLAAVDPDYRGTPRPVRGLVDLVDGRAEWDDRQARKRADWVVEEQPVRLGRW